MRWCERRLAGPVWLPASIEQHPTLASERAMQVGAAQMGSNDVQRYSTIPDADVRNVLCSKRGAVSLTDDELQSVRTENVLFK